MTPDPQLRPAGHVLVPAATISALSMLLVVGLHALGLLARVDGAIVHFVDQSIVGGFPKSLPPWAIWAGTSVLAPAVSFSILTVPSTWRRWVLWITALVIVAGWGPVLALAAHAPEIAAPWIATFWSGFCAVIYATNHAMACDQPHTAESNPTENPHEAR